MTLSKEHFSFILGPCLIEDMGHAVKHATFLRRLSDEYHVPIIYKSSYRKDNRTSGDSPRGPGKVIGCDVLKEVRKILPVVTDVHNAEDAYYVSSIRNAVDVIQIPAMLSRQTSILEVAGRSGKQVLIKKGQWMGPFEAGEAADKTGRADTIICERGTFFGYGRTVIDFENIFALRAFRYLTAIDVTHSVSSPIHAISMAKAACQFVDAVFAECHENPPQAPSDGRRMLNFYQVESLVDQVLEVRNAVK